MVTLSLLAAAMFLMVALNNFTYSPKCLDCGGWGKHREDCKWRG